MRHMHGHLLPWVIITTECSPIVHNVLPRYTRAPCLFYTITVHVSKKDLQLSFPSFFSHYKTHPTLQETMSLKLQMCESVTDLIVFHNYLHCMYWPIQLKDIIHTLLLCQQAATLDNKGISLCQPRLISKRCMNASGPVQMWLVWQLISLFTCFYFICCFRVNFHHQHNHCQAGPPTSSVIHLQS